MLFLQFHSLRGSYFDLLVCLTSETSFMLMVLATFDEKHEFIKKQLYNLGVIVFMLNIQVSKLTKDMET